jgi:hypothetical protein
MMFITEQPCGNTMWKDVESPELEHVLFAFSKTKKKNSTNTGEEEDVDAVEVDGYVLAGCNAALGILCRTWHSSGFDPQTHVTIYGCSSYHEVAAAATAVYGGLLPSQIRGADRSSSSSRGLLLAKVSLPASSFLLSLTASPWIPAIPAILEGTDSSRKKQGGCFLYRPRAIFAEVQGLHSNIKQYFGKETLCRCWTHGWTCRLALRDRLVYRLRSNPKLKS